MDPVGGVSWDIGNQNANGKGPRVGGGGVKWSTDTGDGSWAYFDPFSAGSSRSWALDISLEGLFPASSGPDGSGQTTWAPASLGKVTRTDETVLLFK